jgi:hypothetical protein
MRGPGGAMQTPMEYKAALAACVLESLSSGPKSLHQLARDCRGAYPSLVRDTLAELGQSGTVVVVRDAEYSAQRETDPPPSALAQLEGNPSLASWYFTRRACRTLGQMRDWSQLRLGFLGAPRLYEWFAKAGIGRSRVVLDLDQVVLRRLAALTSGSKDAVIRYDVADSVPVELRDAVDVVFFDPPWYLEHYFVWLRRAAAMSPRGVVIFPLFPELTRPGAAEERSELLSVVDSIAERRWLLEQFVDYDVPTFESAELASCGLADVGTWKVADVVVAELAKDAEPRLHDTRQLSRHAWEEIDVGAIRFFVDPTRTFEEPRLLFLAEGWSPILPSPSRRDPQRAAANVLTSRGHGVLCARPTQFIAALRAAADCVTAGESPDAEFRRLGIDEDSIRLFGQIIRD